jgi:predicted amidohydrolase
MTHTVAAIQMTSSATVEENLKTAGDLIQQAAQLGAELVVLPEIFPIMGNNPLDKIHIREQEGKGPIQAFLAEQAATYKIWIIGGTIPLEASSPHKIRAACLVYNAKGEQVARYDKMHLFDVSLDLNQIYNESATVEPGNQVVVVETPVGKVGLSVCYDIRFPELFRAMFNQGAEIITIPAAFTVPTGQAHWELLARARAVESFCYVMGACQAGKHDNGRETYGHSLIVEPWGSVVASLPEARPGVITAKIDLAYLREKRKAIPVDKHQRIQVDTASLLYRAF